MDTLRNAIKSIVEEAAGRGGVILVSDEAFLARTGERGAGNRE